MSKIATVLMPVYNVENYIDEAIESILNQSFQDFSIIVVDDASTDNTLIKLQEYTDTRIRIIESNRNSGLASCLNRGLSRIKSKYVIRMDGDDISNPDRFQVLLDYMEENAWIDVCSSYLEIFDSKILNKPNGILKFPENHDDIVSQLMFNCSIGHASGIWRNDTFQKFNIRFDVNLRYSEDYDLWVRHFDKLKFHTLPSVLYRYRKINTSTSKLSSEYGNSIRSRYLQKIGVEYSSAELDIHNMLALNDFKKDDKSYFFEIDKWLTKVRRVNSMVSSESLGKVLELKWYQAFNSKKSTKLSLVFKMSKSEFWNLRYKISFVWKQCWHPSNTSS